METSDFDEVLDVELSKRAVVVARHPNYIALILYTASKDLKTVLNDLLDVNVKWKELGLTLEIRQGKLNAIDYDKRNAGERMWETISFWLSGNGSSPTSWRTLLAALRDPLVGERKLADDIQAKLTLSIR